MRIVSTPAYETATGGSRIVNVSEDEQRAVRARLHGAGVAITVLMDNGYAPVVHNVWLDWAEFDAIQAARRA